MPKLYSAKTILSTLERAGFIIVSQKGSHIKLQKRLETTTLTAIVPNHKEVARGTFRSILKQANMTNEEFESFLKS